jgi:hypothetical protein
MIHDSTIHHSPSTARQSSAPLRLFTQPSVIKEIGYERLFRFFRPFATDLQSAEIPWPDFRPGDDEFYVNLARLLNLASFPQPPRSVLDRLERLAAPENRPLLDSIFVQQLSHVTIPTTSPALHRALELWFLSPQLVTDLTDSLLEPSSLAAPKSDEGGLAAPTCHVVALAKTEADEGGLAAPKPSEGGLAAPKPSEGGLAPPQSDEGEPKTSDSAPIENQNSKFENDSDPCSSVSIRGSPSGPIENQNSSPRETLAPCDEKLSHSGASIPACLTGAKIENDPPSTLQLPPGWVMQVEPWPEPVNGMLLLDSLRQLFTQCVILPNWVPELLPLFVLHTYAYHLRDVSVYLGIESPLKRCGKTTLLSLLLRLINRPVVGANVSSSSFFHVIQDLKPTLMIDEADRFLKARPELQGILNAGYTPDTAIVIRMGPPAPGSKASSAVNYFSVWCPKVIAQIGHLPDTLADRSIVFRMQRKIPTEQCQRIRGLNTLDLRRQCARFVLDHAQAITNARTEIPDPLNDRAADIWEPLFVLADLVGGDWPKRARDAAVGLAGSLEESNPAGSLLLDIFVAFTLQQAQRLFTRDLLENLKRRSSGRPWMEVRNGKEINDIWLARQLRPFGIRPITLWIGENLAKGYRFDQFRDAFKRYISKADLDAFSAECGRDLSDTSQPTQPPEPGGADESNSPS